jgi:hypothetical protein
MSECFIQLVGGLGNQLFQIAATWAHCKRNGLRLKMSHGTHGGRDTFWSTYTHNFVQYTKASMNQRSPMMIIKRCIWKEPSFAYTQIPAGARSVFGFFQSSKYFNEYADELRSLFTPSSNVQKTMAEKYAVLLANSSDYAVVHIRRGDYFHGVNVPIHGVITESYYQRAMTLMSEQNPSIQFLVFSDDLPWCRTLTWLQGATLVDESDTALALHLMSQFEHYIMSNSTFSWWAVWLGTSAKTVFAPDRWFGPKGPQDFQDIYEPKWIKVSV